MLKFIENFLDIEYHQLILLYFSSFLFGILVYFALSWEPDFHYICSIYFSSFALLYFLRFGSVLRFSSIVILFFLTGLFVSSLRTYNLHPISIKDGKKMEVTGIIESIKPRSTGVQIILSNIKNFDSKIRVNVRTNMNDAMIGDRISLHASLNSPPNAALPGSYDFARYAFFSNIGAVGYALSDLKILDIVKNSGYWHEILELRRGLYTKIISAIGKERGNFASAIMLGETAALNRDIINNMRAAGISHILAVSGLHLALVAMLFFLLFRLLLNLIPYIAHYTDVKQVAAIFALAGSFGYLMISGMQVAAIRAFIMTFIVILAIILKRTVAPMRSLCIAAFVILSLYPEYALHPSFHLSFTAVIALISGYESYVIRFPYTGSSTLLYNLKLYLCSNIYSTILAGFATAPFVIYHFYIYSNYAILANLAAVPLISFIVMPAAIFTFIVAPFGLEYIPLFLVDIGIKVIIDIAAYISELPYAILYFGHISTDSLMIYISGLLLLCFLKSRVRLFGIIPIIISLIIMFNTKKPDMIIGGKYNIAINNNGILEIDKSLNNFMSDYWTSWFGQKDILYRDGNIGNKDFIINGKIVAVRYFDAKCGSEDLMINFSKKYLRCKNQLVIHKRDINKRGTHLVFLGKDQVRIESNDSKRFKFN